MNAHNHAFGTILRRARVAKRLSQGEVATAIGVTVSAVSQFETGKIGPSGVSLLKIACLLNIDLAKPGPVQPAQEAMPEQEMREGVAHAPSRVSHLKEQIEEVIDLLHALDKIGDGIGGADGYAVSAVALAAKSIADNVLDGLRAMSRDPVDNLAAVSASRATRACTCEGE